MNVLNGGDFLSGFASGAVSSLLSGFQSAGARFNFFSENLTTVGMVAVGGLSGGLSSVIAGGNFWDGMRQGLITSALNHVAHEVFEKGTDKQNGGKKGEEQKQPATIEIHRVWETENSTISTFVTCNPDGTEAGLSGYIMEPAGPSTTQSGTDRRIPAGEYSLVNHSSDSYKNVFKLYNDQVSKDRGILIHPGNNPSHTEGCLMPGSTRDIDWVGGSKDILKPLNQFINKHIYNIKIIITDPLITK